MFFFNIYNTLRWRLPVLVGLAAICACERAAEKPLPHDDANLVHTINTHDSLSVHDEGWWSEGDDVRYLPTPTPKKPIAQKPLDSPTEVAVSAANDFTEKGGGVFDSIAHIMLATADSLGLDMHLKENIGQKDSIGFKNIINNNISKNPKKHLGYSIDFLLGHFDPAKHLDFVAIARKYASRSDLFMQREAYEAFEKMHAAALADGFNLKILSATRSFYQQKVIWDAKWLGKRKVSGKMLAQDGKTSAVDKAKKILEYSAMPGTSRHHWGTDIDLNALENAYFEAGEGAKLYAWLKANAAKFGFGQPYSVKGTERANGYEEEKWHWSYLPLAKNMLAAYKTLGTNEEIATKPFAGAKVAVEIDVVNNYVLSIHESCK